MRKGRTSIKTLVREGYNSIGSEYAASRERSWPAGAGIQDWLVDNAKFGMRILDIGCGAGPLVEMLHQTGKNIDYIGLDNSSALLDEAQARFGKNYHNISCEWLEADMDNLPDLEGEFDIICMIASLHHIPSSRARSQALVSAIKLLKPEGHICITNWYIWTKKFWKRFKIYKQAVSHPFRVLLSRDIFVPWKNKAGETMTTRYIHGFKKEEVSGLLHKSNFIIVQNKLYSKQSSTSIATSICTIGKK